MDTALLAAQWRSVHHADATGRRIHRLTCNELLSRQLDIPVLQEIRRSAPVGATNAARQLWAAARFASAATPPRCPVLLLSSATGHLVNPLCSARLAAAWRVPHQQHPRGGHDLPHDDAPSVCQQVADWRAAHSPK